MSASSFSALIRRASRMAKSSTRPVGPAPDAATLAGSAQKSKTRKKARQKCQRQVEQCNSDFATILCAGAGPDCLLQVQACCPLLGGCDIEGFFACLIPDM